MKMNASVRCWKRLVVLLAVGCWVMKGSVAMAIESATGVVPSASQSSSLVNLSKTAIIQEETSALTRFRVPLKNNQACSTLPTVQEDPIKKRSIVQLPNAQLLVPFMLPMTVTASAGRNAQSIYVESLPPLDSTSVGRLQIVVNYTVPTTFNWQCDAKRKQLVLEVQEAFTYQEAIQSLGSGLDYAKTKVALGVGQQHWVHVLTWKPQSSAFNLVPALPKEGLRGKATVKATLQKENAVAGVNASYFNHQLGLPLGFLMKDGELLTGPVFNRVVLGLSNTGMPRLERLALKAVAQAETGQTVPVHTVNQPRLQANTVALYTSLWGGTAPPAGGGTISLLVRQGKLKGVTPVGNTPIGTEDWILYGPETLLNPIANLPLETPIELLLSTTPDWSDKQHLIAGGPFLVKDGKPFIDLAAQTFKGLPPAERTSRTAVGIKPDGSVLVVAMEKTPWGVTLPQAANILIQLGVQEGMNFDGGSSTQMVVNGQVVYPTNSSWIAPVTTALVFVPVKKITMPALQVNKTPSKPPVPFMPVVERTLEKANPPVRPPVPLF
jgi:hypothetical protein